MVESSIVTYEDDNDSLLVDYQKGSKYSVEFDFIKIWNFYKEYKYIDIDLLNFYHVHPNNLLCESAIDINCMKGFFQAFGMSSPFHIICFENSNINDLRHKSISISYEKNGIIVKYYGYEFKDENLLILKLLAYGGFNERW